MNQGTKIVAVVLFVLFTGTAIYYVTLSPAKPASPTAPKAAETPAKAPEKPADLGPGSITMNPPGAPVASPTGPRIVDPLASGSASTPTPSAGGTPAASSPTAPTAPPRITLGPGGTPSAVMPPLNVTRSTPPAVPLAGTPGGVTGETASTASPVRPTTPVVATSPSSSTPASSGSSSVREHVVASGDTLSSIAARYLGSENRWEEIAKANPGVNPNSMRVGTKLSIPAGLANSAGAASSPSKPASTAVATSPSAPATAASAGEYVVKAGDTLTGIARQTLGSADWEAIYEANRSLIGPNPAALRVGMKLAIPKRS